MPQNFFAGLHMFTQGVQNFRQRRAIADANRLVADIRSRKLDTTEKNLQLGHVVQDLTFNLMERGASVQEAAMATQALIPQTSQNFFQSLDQVLANTQPGDPRFDQAQGILQERREHQMEIERARGERTDRRTEAQERRFQTQESRRIIDAFVKKPEIRELSTDRAAIERTLPIIETLRQRVEGKRSDEALDVNLDGRERHLVNLTQAQIARLVSNQRLSNDLYAEARFSQSWLDRTSNALKRVWSGNATTHDVRTAYESLKAFEQATEKALRTQAGRHVHQTGRTADMLGISRGELFHRLMGQPFAEEDFNFALEGAAPGQTATPSDDSIPGPKSRREHGLRFFTPGQQLDRQQINDAAIYGIPPAPKKGN